MILGPGTLRVGRFIGRLGVVSLPAVEVGLDLDQRVVRRHVAKLQAAGWLARAAWVWGEGSVVWLTDAGVERIGLGGLRAVKSPPAPTTIAHAVLAAWSAARAERRGRTWMSARELAVESERWAVPARCERGNTEQLPDLAVWLTPSGPPWAVIAESGGRRDDRQQMILEGWHEAVLGGRYAGVRYDCASESVARRMSRLARKLGFTPPSFSARVQTTREEIGALARTDAAAEGLEVPHPDAAAISSETSLQPIPSPSLPKPEHVEPAESPPPEPVRPEAAEERERSYRQIMGLPEPKRRRWRH